jgi:hypothetical protein
MVFMFQLETPYVVSNMVWNIAGKSGRGLPQSKTLARLPMTFEMREASWTASALWRFGNGRRAAVVSGFGRSLTQ